MFASITNIDLFLEKGGVFDVLRARFFPSIFRPPVFDPRNQDLSVEFFHSAASCAARLVPCKPPICVCGACHHSAPPKARVDQGQSGTSQNRLRRCQAVGLSGQAPSIAPVLVARPGSESVVRRRRNVGIAPKAVVQQTTNDGRALRKTIASATTELMRRSKCSGRAVMIYSQREACLVDSGAHEVKDRLPSCSIIPR
jgi:hypothetical protein